MDEVKYDFLVLKRACEFYFQGKEKKKKAEDKCFAQKILFAKKILC